MSAKIGLGRTTTKRSNWGSVMMKRTAGAVVLVLAGLVGVPAAGAVGVATPVSGVTIAWADSTHTQVRITWSESRPVANTVKLLSTIYQPRNLGSTTADGANELLVNARSLNGTYPQEIATIAVTDPDGGQATSVEFDRYTRVVDKVSLAFTADGGVRWTIPPDPTSDITPNDPLDLAGTTSYQPVLNEVRGDIPHCTAAELAPIKALTGVIPDQHQAYGLHVVAANEWSQTIYGNSLGRVDVTGLSIAAPYAGRYGETTTISGVLSRRILHDSSEVGGCDQAVSPLGGAAVVLQARTTSTSAWYVVGSAKTTTNGSYSFPVRNPGARQYRVVRASSTTGGQLSYGVDSPAKPVRSVTKVDSAKFITPVIDYGTKPQAYLWVDPARSQRAALQYYAASGLWQGVTYKVLSSGRGIATFPWNLRGTFQFRWWVPGSTSSEGLPVEATYTGEFTLDVRWN